MTLPEVLLWQALRREQLEGLRFRRQHPIGCYVLDFYCEQARLVVEVDGRAHEAGDNPRRDEIRDTWLESQGLRVLRLPATYVLQELDNALISIAYAASRP